MPKHPGNIFALLFTLTMYSVVFGQEPGNGIGQSLATHLAGRPDYQKTKSEMIRLRSSHQFAVGIALHRAANEFAPENTLAAIACALELEADYIEIDVRLTSDGQSVILHDGTLDRTTNGKGPLRAMKFEDVRKLSAGGWFDPCFAAEKIPTLSEACQMVAEHNRTAGHKTYFYIDCKDIHVPELIENLTKHDLIDGSVFYVNKVQQIAEIRKVAPSAKILPGLENARDMERVIQAFHPYALDLNWKDISAGLINRAHANGVKIFSDGFGENQSVKSYSQAIKAGIDVISTNKVSVIYDSVESK